MKTKQIVYLLFILLIAFNCTERIDVALNDSSPRLVVDGTITTDTMLHFVRLSVSGSYFANEPMPPVTNARVTLSDGHDSFRLIESDKYPGYYVTADTYYGLPGRTYSLLIENIDIDKNGYPETYTAESYLNPVAPVDSVRLEYHEIWDLWKVLLYANEPGETIDFYMFKIAINKNLYTDQLTEVSTTDDRFFNGNYASGVWVHSINLDDEDLNFNPGDTVTLQMSGITEHFKNYIDALQEETRMNVPLFSGPPANLPGNISNGALGYFRAYSTSEASTIHTGKKD